MGASAAGSVLVGSNYIAKCPLISSTTLYGLLSPCHQRHFVLVPSPLIQLLRMMLSLHHDIVHSTHPPTESRVHFLHQGETVVGALIKPSISIQARVAQRVWASRHPRHHGSGSPVSIRHHLRPFPPLALHARPVCEPHRCVERPHAGFAPGHAIYRPRVPPLSKLWNALVREGVEQHVIVPAVVDENGRVLPRVAEDRVVVRGVARPVLGGAAHEGYPLVRARRGGQVHPVCAVEEAG
mmetsp:Transcript_51464/g.109460  ORF Transcript_51464/g.109460 Transcript_51464/m.109460 type:complete len:239 (+) Transcript_51464:127-843(+)